MACINAGVKCTQCIRSFCEPGSPTIDGEDGWFWFNTSTSTLYIWCDGQWHTVSGTPHVPGTDTADYWFFMLMGTSNAR